MVTGGIAGMGLWVNYLFRQTCQYTSVQIYTYICVRIWFAAEGGGGGPKLLPLGPCWALVRPFRTERCDACSERSDEVRDCKQHITQSKDLK